MEVSGYFEQIRSLGQTHRYSAGEDLLREGDQAKYLFYIESGGVRLWHNDDGRDITVQFFFEQQAVASFESFYLEQPSIFAITAFEPTTALVVDGEKLHQLLRKDSDLMMAFTNQICQRFIDYTHYFLTRIEQSPEQRYRSLLTTNPALATRVPQHELASYLGITPVSLSRIRNRLKKESES